MTAAEYHQQQLEQQEMDYKEINNAIAANHGRLLGAAHTIRDSKLDPHYVRIAVNSILEALEEYETLMRRMK
jgi:hypothetical protein